MPNRLERFTQRAQRALSLAQEEAERLQHNYIGTEHLLLGLIREEGGVAGRVLRELVLDQKRVEELVERMTRATTRTTTGAQPELSPGTKRVLELAVDEARRMGHPYIGTEHLLLGLVRLTEGVAIDILKRLGVSPEEVRRQTRRVLQESPLTPKPPETESRPPDPPETQWRSPIPPKGILLSDYTVRVIIRDAETKEQKAEFDVRLDRLQVELYNLNGRIFQGKEVDPIEWRSGENQIEVIVEKAKD
jgi:ATP-dependent Clp protease ATP-binding subunit ClpC